MTTGQAKFRRVGDAIELLQAPPLIEIEDEVLANGDGRFLTLGDGIVTFHCVNGDVSYGLSSHDALRRTWIGIRSDPD